LAIESGQDRFVLTDVLMAVSMAVLITPSWHWIDPALNIGVGSFRIALAQSAKPITRVP
jgi:TRAP-type C4-dicarboxylate transport system permease small subunit